MVMLNGLEHTFTPDQRTDVGAESNIDDVYTEIRAYGWSRRDFNENLDAGYSGGHPIILQATRDLESVSGDDPQLIAFGIFGNPTTDFSHMSDVTATYGGDGGWAWISTYVSDFEADNFDWDEDRTPIWSGDLEFTANFSKGTISGSIKDFKEWGTDEAVGLSLTMPETSFGAEASSGRFGVSSETHHIDTASYDASFWGPDADALAGTMSLSGTLVEGGETAPFVPAPTRAICQRENDDPECMTPDMGSGSMTLCQSFPGGITASARLHACLFFREGMSTLRASTSGQQFPAIPASRSCHWSPGGLAPDKFFTALQ